MIYFYYYYYYNYIYTHLWYFNIAVENGLLVYTIIELNGSFSMAVTN
jgi:hypothetical protein